MQHEQRTPKARCNKALGSLGFTLKAFSVKAIKGVPEDIQ